MVLRETIENLRKNRDWVYKKFFRERVIDYEYKTFWLIGSSEWLTKRPLYIGSTQTLVPFLSLFRGSNAKVS